MLRLLVPIILIYISQGAYAFENQADMQSVSSVRDFSSISNLIRDLEDLDCVATCQGDRKGNACGQFKDMDSCIDDGAALGCYVTCQ